MFTELYVKTLKNEVRANSTLYYLMLIGIAWQSCLKLVLLREASRRCLMFVLMLTLPLFVIAVASDGNVVGVVGCLLRKEEVVCPPKGVIHMDDALSEKLKKFRTPWVPF